MKAISAKLIRYLDVMKDVNAVKYADFVVAITQAIDEQNAVIAMRYTLDEKKEGGRRRWHQEARRKRVWKKIKRRTRKRRKMTEAMIFRCQRSSGPLSEEE